MLFCARSGAAHDCQPADPSPCPGGRVRRGLLVRVRPGRRPIGHSAGAEAVPTAASAEQRGRAAGRDALAVRDGEKVEWFWIAQFSHAGDQFEGRINNTPRLVRTVSEGQAIRFERKEIVDSISVL